MKPSFPSLTKTLCRAVLCCALFLAAGGGLAQAALYDLDKTDVSYTSDGESYTLSLYEPQDVIRESPRGEYWIEDWAQSGWDAWFDYDEDTETFTLYNNAGPHQRLMFLDDGELLVDELLRGQVIDQQLYERGADGIYSTYVPSIGRTWTLDRYITDALEIFADEGPESIEELPYDYTSTVPGDGSQRDFVLQKTPKTAAPRVHSKRYLLASDYDDNEWVAFSYDASTGIFAMYDAYSGDEPYAYRKFSSDYSRMENQATTSRTTSGVFHRDASGNYRGDTVDIYKYITDGLLIFLKDVRK